MEDQHKPEMERSVDVHASPDEVWERIVDGELDEEWLGVSVEPRPGGPVRVPDSDTIGTVEEVEPGRSITWSWRQPDGDPSQVTIQIEPIETGSRVTVTERMLDYKVTGSPPVFFAMAA
ncbi:MAG: SRPBCC family protein [Acidimicrobiia bacterium]